MISKRIFTKYFILLSIISSLGTAFTDSSTINSETHKNNSLICILNKEWDKFQSEDRQETMDEPLGQYEVDVVNFRENIQEDDIKETKDVEEVYNGAIIAFDIAPLQLREGIASDEVFRIREYLKEKGYTDIGQGSYFDHKLDLAIKEFQSENNLKPDGIVGPMTFRVINDDMIINSISIRYNEIILADDIPEERWILINKESNTLYLYNNIELIDRYPIASGKTPDHTPEGKFYILKKFINPYWGGAGIYKPIKGGDPDNPLGKRWLGLSIRGGGTYGIHGNSDSNSIGKFVSLGCIRMFNSDIEYLFDLVEYNTPVWIIGNNPIVDL